ncbi:MAG: Glu/Leu/Phe/Val family dehydrogenase [Planctomycetota bacterium]|jgi:leucine dehydrogenase
MSTFDQMIERGHERVGFHQDPATGLRAIIAVHSTKRGPGFGGIRRWHYATEADALHDVLRLSETMTRKAAAAGLPMGGAMSVIQLPEPGHPAGEAEGRAMGRFIDTFDGAYIAAEDVGVDTRFMDWAALETRHVMGGERNCSGGDPSPHTARGVFNSMKAALAHLGLPVEFENLRVAVQGVGHVGYSLTRLLANAGATVTVADIARDRVQRVVDEFGAVAAAPEDILTVECDILSPCALGAVIDANLARKLRCRAIVAGANNPLDDPNEDAVILKSLGILYCPSFVANAGGAIQLSCTYLGISDDQIAQKIDDIETTTARVLRDAESMTSTFAAAIAIVDHRLREGSRPSTAHGSRGRHRYNDQCAAPVSLP